MDFFTVKTVDGLELVGLYSPSKSDAPLILHIHGYGGDFYSNQFVRECHRRLPRRGIAFASVGLRTTGYLSECYTENSVTYIGSAVADHDGVKADVDAALDWLLPRHRSLILQGHSFGTNVVKRQARSRRELTGVVLLSPSDSVGLYRQWVDAAGSETDGDERVDDSWIRWCLFGVTTPQRSYPIPITASALRRLLRSEVFREWSPDAPQLQQPALLVQGEADDISLYGVTGNLNCLTQLLPNSVFVRIPGARHQFTGSEGPLLETIGDWVLNLVR